MTHDESDKRQELRFQLKGAFNNVFFALGSRTVAAEPIDISRNGLGLIIDDTWNHDDIVSLRIMFLEDHLPITLNVRSKVLESEGHQLRARTRCGLELSDLDKRRGIDLINLLQSTNSGLQLLCG